MWHALSSENRAEIYVWKPISPAAGLGQWKIINPPGLRGISESLLTLLGFKAFRRAHIFRIRLLEQRGIRAKRQARRWHLFFPLALHCDAAYGWIEAISFRSRKKPPKRTEKEGVL
jgi:hypothetical protein